jgi:hypothetical protein
MGSWEDIIFFWAFLIALIGMTSYNLVARAYSVSLRFPYTILFATLVVVFIYYPRAYPELPPLF